MAKTNPFEFIQQVRAEVAKVTWPTRNETVITTIMVIIMSSIMALILFGVDRVILTALGFFGIGQ
ncbi:MAG: preprotein translocase subunit SecE [Methyloligellaceae bacterium]